MLDWIPQTHWTNSDYSEKSTTSDNRWLSVFRLARMKSAPRQVELTNCKFSVTSSRIEIGSHENINHFFDKQNFKNFDAKQVRPPSKYEPIQGGR